MLTPLLQGLRGLGLQLWPRAPRHLHLRHGQLAVRGRGVGGGAAEAVAGPAAVEGGADGVRRAGGGHGGEDGRLAAGHARGRGQHLAGENCPRHLQLRVLRPQGEDNHLDIQFIYIFSSNQQANSGKQNIYFANFLSSPL